SGPMITLPVFVYRSYADQGQDAQAYLDRAWTGALTLILIVMLLNPTARLSASRFAPKRRGGKSRPAAMSKRIAVKDLNVFYGRFKAVEDVNLAVEPRTVTAFTGPSGRGQSTFLRTLNRMHEVIPGAYVVGQVLLDG